ncbi:MAG: NifU family protein [Proteobacteria bacterium]|nr:NifU family protein [Pseudomonadota bacterium]MCZ6783412.1 NifU family protein [Pseudomonadota bacterium]
MHAERTPNPNSIKWVLSQPVVEGVAAAHFDAAPSPAVSPMAAALFAVAGVHGVFFGPSFVTVTKADDIEWADLAQPIVEAIKSWAESGEPALGPDYQPPAASEGESGEVVARIIEILENEIRPYVAMDGGEITFAGYRDGVVEVYLQGSCSGCPSSTVTLKAGIESRLREEIPEVREVVAL